MTTATPSAFLNTSDIYFPNKQTKCLTTLVRRFASRYGCTPRHMYLVWAKLFIYDLLPPGSKYKHLLMALHFLKVYGNEACLSVTFDITEKTFRKWTWLFIDAMSDLSKYEVSHFNANNYTYFYNIDCHILIYHTQFYTNSRLNLVRERRVHTTEVNNTCPWTERTSEYASLLHFGKAGIRSNLRGQAFVMKLAWPYEHAN